MKLLRICLKGFKKWTPSESVTSWGMPRVGLREVIFVSLLLALSTDLAVANKGLQTNETEPEDLPQAEKDLNHWKEKSAAIIHRLPGLLTKNMGGNLTLRFLNLTETKTERDKMKETSNGMIIRESLGRFVKFLNHFSIIRNAPFQNTYLVSL